MFICKECRQEYKNRPQYCDCGNDTFDEILDESKKINLLEKYDISIISLSFFVLCIFLSIIALLFFPYIPEKSKVKHEPVILKQLNTNIPSLDSFWIDEQPVTEKPDTEPAPVEVIPQIVKTIPTPRTKNETIKTTTVKAQPVTTKTQTVQKTNTVPQTKINTNSKLQISNYKIAIRNKLFSNLSISSIQGSGKCGIEFSVDENGKLINRAFTFQSDNKSVNDEVYKMMMRTPVVTAPPSGYNGEKIKLIFSFDNGSFEISFAN